MTENTLNLDQFYDPHGKEYLLIEPPKELALRPSPPREVVFADLVGIVWDLEAYKRLGVVAEEISLLRVIKPNNGGFTDDYMTRRLTIFVDELAIVQSIVWEKPCRFVLFPMPTIDHFNG